MKKFQVSSKLSRGDQVGIISPSAGLPEVFPWVQDLGLERMRSIFDLQPIEYTTTRTMGAPLEDRARDIMKAFSDPNNKAIFASIGGHDQIELLKYLDPQVFLSNPKPFFGFSDNTHLHVFLWNLGIPSYYGGGIMNQFAMNNAMFDVTIDSIKHALFDNGEFVLEVSDNYTDEGLDWSIKKNLHLERKVEPNSGLIWDGNLNTEGTLWGGCVESLIAQVAAQKYLPSDNDIDGTILVLETAEDIPEHWIIEYLLVGLGERGWLNAFRGILVGRPKAWEFNKRLTPEQKSEYRKLQQETVVNTVRRYNKQIPIVQNLDFGHTDPQIVLPLGQKARIVTNEKKIYLNY